MFNLLRMDLYRIKRSKSLYICLGFLLFATLCIFSLLWLLTTPEGQTIALQIGMLIAGDVEDASNILNGIDILILFRQIGLDGGLYSVILGIWVMLFICSDYQNGFIKNIMAIYSNRWLYLASKLLAVGIVNLCYLVIQFGFTLLINYLFKNIVPYTKIKDVLFYLTWAWLLTMAFSVLIILICIYTRSIAAGSFGAILLGSGLIVVPLYQIMHLLHLGEWLKYSIYFSLSYGPNQYTSLQDLQVFIIGIVFLVLYSITAGILLKKQDI